MISSNVFLHTKLVVLNNLLIWVSNCDANIIFDIIILIFVAISFLIGVLYMLPTGREILKHGIKGLGYSIGYQIGKTAYEAGTGGGDDDNKDKTKTKTKTKTQTQFKKMAKKKKMMKIMGVLPEMPTEEAKTVRVKQEQVNQIIES